MQCVIGSLVDLGNKTVIYKHHNIVLTYTWSAFDYSFYYLLLLLNIHIIKENGLNRLLNILLAGIFLASSSTAWAKAELSYPDTLSLIKVDNKSYTWSFWDDPIVELSEGRHVIILKYKELFDNPESDDHVTIKSEPFVLLFTAEEGQSYHLEHEVLSEESEARVFAQNPTLVLKNKDNQVVDIFTQDLVAFEARAIFNSVENASTMKPANVLPKALPVAAPDNAAANLPQSPQALNQATLKKAEVNQQAYDMLTYWWKQASMEQKALFIQDINNGSH